MNIQIESLQRECAAAEVGVTIATQAKNTPYPLRWITVRYLRNRTLQLLHSVLYKVERVQRVEAE